MSRYTVEITIKGSTRPARLNYNTKEDAMNQWDTSVDNALGGDKLRLLDNTTGRILSEYNPLDNMTGYEYAQYVKHDAPKGEG